MKENQSLVIWEGQSLQVTVNVDAAGSTTAQALTGATLGVWFCSDDGGSATDAALVLRSTDSEVSLVNVDGTNDGIRFTIWDTDSALLTSGPYFYEVWAKDTSSNVAPVAKGILNVKAATGSL